jgi:hypothetical protein
MTTSMKTMTTSMKKLTLRLDYYTGTGLYMFNTPELNLKESYDTLIQIKDKLEAKGFNDVNGSASPIAHFTGCRATATIGLQTTPEVSLKLEYPALYTVEFYIKHVKIEDIDYAKAFINSIALYKSLRCDAAVGECLEL